MEHHHENFITRNNLATPISIVIAGALIALAIFFDGGSSNNQVPQQAQKAQAPKAQAVDISKLRLNVNDPFVGNANAPLTIALWTDYQCPFCKRFEEDSITGIYNDYVKSGKAKIIFKDFAFLGPDSTTAAIAGRAVWEVDQSKYYAWRTEMYAKQGAERSGWASKDKVIAITSSVLGASEAARVSSLMETKKDVYQKAIDADKQEGSSLGVTGTPGTIIGKQFVNGAQSYQTVKPIVEASLK